MAIEPEPLPHERIEVLGQEVGEVERAGLGLVQRREQLGAGDELVAVVAGQAGAFARLGEQAVELAAGAAVGVADQDRSLAVSSASASSDRRDDPLRAAVEWAGR